MTTRYALDKSNARFLGVCSGLSRSTGIDATLIRIATVLATLFALGPIALLIYFVAAFAADAR